MGSFRGVNIYSQNFHQTVNLAQQKAFMDEQYRLALVYFNNLILGELSKNGIKF